MNASLLKTLYTFTNIYIFQPFPTYSSIYLINYQCRRLLILLEKAQCLAGVQAPSNASSELKLWELYSKQLLNKASKCAYQFF